MNDELIVLENIVDGDGMCQLHLMSNGELDVDAAKTYNAPVDAVVAITHEAGACHLRATWPVRGLMKIYSEEWPGLKIFVMWNLDGCASMSEAIRKAAKAFQDIYGRRPIHAYARQLPRGIEDGAEVGDDLMLFEADWIPRKCVAVGWIVRK